MPTTFEDLSDQEKSGFEAKVRALGIDPSTIPKTIVADGTLRLSPNPDMTNVPTTLVKVESLQQMKRLFGVPDEVFTSGRNEDNLSYPAPLQEERARLLGTARDSVLSSITQEEHLAVQATMESYMHGNSASVPESLISLANALRFPVTVQTLVVENLIIDGPFDVSQNLTAGTITINPGGYLNVIGDVSIYASTIKIGPAN